MKNAVSHQGQSVAQENGVLEAVDNKFSLSFE